ncbi:hypothetical protein Hanom_Chr06g00546001 [Helianthus anomalus]
MYLVCISGNKSGINTLTIRQTSRVIALVENWSFNYSKCVFDDMLANVKSINKKYWLKFPRFLQMILNAKYPSLQQTVSIYDTKMMNHIVFGLIKQVRKDVQVLYENKRQLERFGAFPEVVEPVPALVNASVAKEHDVQIIDAPLRVEEPVENIDLIEVESEEENVENVFEENLMADAEVNENDGEDETETLAVERINKDQLLSVNPHQPTTFEQVSAEPDVIQEDPIVDLHPRKQSRRNPRISCEMTRVSSSSPDVNILVVTTSQPGNTTGTPVSDVFIEFRTNPKVAMYMPTSKTGEESSNTPSDAEVLRAVSLLEQAVRDRVVADKPIEEEVQEPASSPDSENLFGDVDVGVMIKSWKKFGKEFAKPRKEYSPVEKEQLDKEREEALNKYIQDPPRVVNQRLKQKEVIMRNVGREKDSEFQDLSDRYVVTIRKDRYDRYGNQTGIKSWAYNDEKGLFLVTRNNENVGYYNSASSFQSWTAVDRRELSWVSYHDQ